MSHIQKIYIVMKTNHFRYVLMMQQTYTRLELWVIQKFFHYEVLGNLTPNPFSVAANHNEETPHALTHYQPFITKNADG